MKAILTSFFLGLLTISFGQSISNQKDIHPYNGDFGDIYFLDNERILTTSAFEKSFILDATGKKIKELDIIKNGESCWHPNGKKVGIVGTQYYDEENQKVYTSVLQIVDLATGDVEHIMFEKMQIQRFNFHPTNDDLIAAIMMDENFEYQSNIVNIRTKKIEQVCLQGKGAFIPLTNDFTSDGKHLYCGFGTGPYNGGFTYYDIEAKKEIKRISFKDQPLDFMMLEHSIIMRGNKSIREYNHDWVEVNKFPLRIAAVHPSGKFGIHFTQDKKAQIIDLITGDKTTLDIPVLKDQDFSKVAEFHGYARFSSDGAKLAIKFFRWNKFKEVKMPDKPSFMTFEVSY